MRNGRLRFGCDGLHLICADTGSQQTLVRITESCIRQENAVLVFDPFAHCCRAFFIQDIFGGNDFLFRNDDVSRNPRLIVELLVAFLDTREAINGNVSDVLHRFVTTVTRFREFEQFRRRIDECRFRIA